MLHALQRYADWLHLQWPAGEVEKLPRVDDDYRTNVEGVYVVGDLAGIPLLKFSIDSGVKAVRHAANDLNLAGRGDGAPSDPPEGTEDDPVPIAVLGAGAAGMAAAREAQSLGIDTIVLEANRRFATIKDFQKGKPIYTYPQSMTPEGDLTVSADVKEALVEELEAQTQDLPVRTFDADRIARRGELLVVESESGEKVFAERVIVAIGRSGNFRSLGVPGEDRDFVHHRLHDPTKWKGRNVLVIGGGDSALEAAIALTEAGAQVTLSYRREEFVRPKPDNIDRAYALATYHGGEGSLRLKMATDVEAIGDEQVVLSGTDEQETIDTEAVYAMIGREAPLDFFRRSGIRLRNDFGDLPNTLKDAVSSVDWLSNVLWRRVGAFAAFFLFMCAVYSWKDGGIVQEWAKSVNLFPFSLSGDPNATGLWSIITTSATKPSFYYTLAYSAIVVIFGFRRIRRRQTPYIRVQTLTLMAVQVLPLFILPEIVLPYFGANGLLPAGFLDALFPTSEWAVHGREYWRAYGFILAWPLLVYNVFTAEPLWWWIGICFVQTFVLIPGMIYFWGKGAYCGWICSCGALAETLGDQHRDKMPHGEGWNKFNLAGQVIMVLAFVLLFLRIGGWVFPGGWMEQAFNQVMFGSLFGLQLNYAWVVDVVLAGMIGYGVYFWLSGRFWCRFLCPLAALMHIYARFSRFRILADKEKCISCNVCTSVCHQGIDVMAFAQKGEPMDDPECVRCSACVQSCPTGVLSFGQVDPSTGAFISRDSLEASAARIREGA
ncbi:pyridine nucleotide-disulfide oxidoreductase [Longibacter salinarum]|uniref:Pyridine nucleotide-disulfide oxidoreductase n=1 Tax=Longibacter salinarum TaxID=1850348 RepID=A0A2A8D2Y9_9BACT|nr:FAD-dependent oxidoreductase [Longibacter salinarum]PEN15250.1 pyridine nucleotide-disulfide oxidoreductase [Longibacter salinarum]